VPPDGAVSTRIQLHRPKKTGNRHVLLRVTTKVSKNFPRFAFAASASTRRIRLGRPAGENTATCERRLYCFGPPRGAADMPLKAPLCKAPPPVVGYNWTGFYVGGKAGYGWGSD
jgi:hypothetical protein